MNVDNKPVAVITGHTGTIGYEISKGLRDRGFYVIGISRRTRPECVDEEHSVDLRLLDADSICKIELLLKTKANIKVFVHAAGVALVRRFEEITRQEFENILNVNLMSAVFLSQICFRLMKTSNDGGVIIFISSQVALSGCAQEYNSIYSMTKCGFNGLVSSLSKEGGPNIRVNAVCPGDFHSTLSEHGKKGFCNISGLTYNEYNRKVIERSAIKRWLQPKEVAEAVNFLIFNQAMTGTMLNISGGSTTS